MQLKELRLSNFKNYELQEIEFSEKLNCLTGKNGMGKTNLLDAIYYLCMCKSHFGTNDSFLVKHESTFFRLEGLFLKGETKESIVAKVIPRKKKEIERNRKVYKKLSEHIGLLPVVFIAPDDTRMATEGSEERRKFIDNTLSQLDANYLQELIRYNKLLAQRNASLKNNESVDPNLIRTYDKQMSEPANFIYEKRKEFVAKLIPLFQNCYAKISRKQEQVNLSYQSKLLENDFLKLMEKNFEKDRILRRTTGGIHRDDLVFNIEEFLLKKFASQGQLKSYVLALKLAQYELIREAKKNDPILLLDDIFDKLDQYRVSQLIELLLGGNFGQIFITDTDPKRLDAILKKLTKDYKNIKVEAGHFS